MGNPSSVSSFWALRNRGYGVRKDHCPLVANPNISSTIFNIRAEDYEVAPPWTKSTEKSSLDFPFLLVVTGVSLAREGSVVQESYAPTVD